MNVQPCGRPECRICRPRQVFEDPPATDGFRELAFGLVALLLIGFLVFVLLPVVA